MRLIWTFLVFLISFPTTTRSSEDWTPQRIVGMVYPRVAVHSRTEGTVRVQCSIAKDGSVSSADIVFVSGPKPAARDLLGKAAVENAKKWRFKKTKEAGTALDSAVLTYTFQLKGHSGTNPRSEFVYEYPGSVLITSEELSLSP